MCNERKYAILLLPEMAVVERACSLTEAGAWAETYNRVIGGEPTRAVITEELSLSQT